MQAYKKKPQHLGGLSVDAFHSGHKLFGNWCWNQTFLWSICTIITLSIESGGKYRYLVLVISVECLPSCISFPTNIPMFHLLPAYVFWSIRELFPSVKKIKHSEYDRANKNAQMRDIRQYSCHNSSKPAKSAQHAQSPKMMTNLTSKDRSLLMTRQWIERGNLHLLSPNETITIE